MNKLQRIRFKLKLNRRKRKALELHKLTGKQYHVVPTFGNRIEVVNRETIKEINKKLPKSQRLTIKDVLDVSLYSTPFVSPFKK